MTSAAVLLAAGAGQRFGTRKPKQFQLLNGVPLFVYSLNVFLRHPSLETIVLVADSKYHSQIKKYIVRTKTRKKILVVVGGKFRGESVRNGFRALKPHPSEVVFVHDTARPLVSAAILNRVEAAAKKVGVSLAAWPLGDTLKLASEFKRVKKTVPRKDLWLAQTPQAFRWGLAQKCLLNPLSSATDDAELAERKGYPVAIVEGSPINIKVTYPSDINLCRVFLKQ